MQYMVIYTPKDTPSPNEQAALLRKFQSWQPPDGITMEGNWNNGYGGYALFRTYTLMCEVLAQYSGGYTFAIDPVTPAEDGTPATLRGLGWAAS